MSLFICEIVKVQHTHTHTHTHTHICRYSVKANLKLEDPEELTSELKLYKRAGGGTVCDVTITGLRSAIHLAGLTPAAALVLQVGSNCMDLDNLISLAAHLHTPH